MVIIDNPSPRLKSLELQGYKTFATKTPFTFVATITAIVGPNGSGKSNISDSIRWVLGEQSYSLLRGKRTEDMIFSGSEERPRASMASATITFDNSDGWLPIDFTEVTISRRAYRDGQNEYLLNGQRVRLRDVLELLASCGLAQRTYTVVGQGLVDAALSLKAEERRRLFEEAAGIGLYRSRREEALRRLSYTRRNLERAQDILVELRPRLRSLERQAKRAGTYEQVKEDLKAALRIWYGYHWYHLLHEVREARSRAENETQSRNEMREQQVRAERQLAATRSRIDALRSQLYNWSQQVSDLYGEREGLGKRLAVAQERIHWLAEQDEFIQSKKASLEQACSEVVERLSRMREDNERKSQELVDAEAERQELIQASAADSSQRQSLLDRARDVRKALEGLAGEEAAWRTRKGQLGERLEALEKQIVEIQVEVESAAVNVAAIRKEAQAARTALEEAANARKEEDENEAELRQQLARVEGEQVRHMSRLSELRARHASLEARLQVIRARSDEIDLVVELLAEAAQDGRLKGWVGGFEEHLKVSSKHRRAIAAALGDFVTGLAFRTLDDVLAALEWLEDAGTGEQAALLPLSTPRPNSPLEPPPDPGCLGVASHLVRAPAEYRPAIDLLLGRTLVVNNRKDARRLLPGLPLDARLVTLGGDIYYPTGQVLIGGGRQEKTSLELKRELETALAEAGEALEKVEAEGSQLSGVGEAIRRALDEAHQSLESAREGEQDARLSHEQTDLAAQNAEQQHEKILAEQRNLEREITQVVEERDELESHGETFMATRVKLEQELQEAVAMLERAEPNVQMARLDALLEVARRTVDEVDGRVVDLEEQMEALEVELKEWTDRLAANSVEQVRMRGEVAVGEEGMRGIEQQLASLSAQMEPTEEELAETEKSRSVLEVEERQLRETLRTSERQHSHAQIDLARREEELVSLRRRIEDDFGLVAFDFDPDEPSQELLPLEGLVQKLPEINELPMELEGQINRLRAQLRRMGAINPEAQHEFNEVRQRSEFLTSQVDDMRQAESQIQEVIAELDLLMEREFRKTYDAVAVAFRQAFTRLFGGGSARLVLTDPDNLTQTGIDIEARLPGRREQGLAMLSGGERSLTACALIFALMEVSPPPFCVLDEVDAMLDDANVNRYIEMLRELSQKTQFILITHNRLTVQAAEAVYGVSMEADSASRVISLKLDEVEGAIAA